METKKFKDFYEYIDYLEINMDDEVKRLCKKYDVTFNHSGGGCIHLGMSLNEDYFLINPYTNDVSYEFENIKKDTYCIFGVDDIDGDYYHFNATLEEGIELINYLRGQ